MTLTDRDVKELGQYTAILTSRLVNNACISRSFLARLLMVSGIGGTVGRYLHMYLSVGRPFSLKAGILRDKTRHELIFKPLKETKK